ncbi:hypothetical protein JCM3775_003760 [Rhodotorula graminis]
MPSSPISTRARRQDVDFWATSKPPEDGTCLFDRLPNEVVTNVLSFLVPDTLVFINSVRYRPPPHEHLLVVRQTCRIMALLCVPILRELYTDDSAQSDPVLQPLLRHLRTSTARARAVRRLVLEGPSFSILTDLMWRLQGWPEVLPNLEELVLSRTQRVKLDTFAPFTQLRHLTVVNTELTLESRRTTSFPSLTSLTLSSATLTEPSILSNSVMPVLRHLAIVDCRVFKWLYLPTRWATNLLPQLEVLEIGEDQHRDADVRLLAPLATLGDTLPVLWCVDLDRALVRNRFPRSHAALRRHVFVRLVLAEPSSPSPLEPARHTSFRNAPSRLAKVLDIVALLPNLELLLVPHDLWLPNARPSSAHAAQQAVVDDCARRGVALRTYDGRGESGEGIVPEFETFLRERASAASGAGL